MEGLTQFYIIGCDIAIKYKLCQDSVLFRSFKSGFILLSGTKYVGRCVFKIWEECYISTEPVHLRSFRSGSDDETTLVLQSISLHIVVKESDKPC